MELPTPPGLCKQDVALIQGKQAPTGAHPVRCSFVHISQAQIAWQVCHEICLSEPQPSHKPPSVTRPKAAHLLCSCADHTDLPGLCTHYCA